MLNKIKSIFKDEEYQNRLKAKLKIEEEKFKEKVLELQKSLELIEKEKATLEKSLELIEGEKEDLQKTLEQEKNEKLKRAEEIESLKNDILKFEEAYSNEVLDKNKVLKELKNLEISYENLEEDIIKEVRRKESLDEELLKVKIEFKVYRSRQDEIIKLKEDFVNDLKSKFSLEMNCKDNLIKKEKEKKEELLEEIEGLKAELIKLENFKLENNSEEIKVNENIENVHSKESSAKEDVEENLANKKLENNKNIEEKEPQILDSKKYGSWFNIEKYHLNKSNLTPIILNFCLDDFKEIHSEAQRRNLLSQIEKIQILNIITWLKFNTPLSSLNMEKIEEIYIKIMDHLIKEESKVKIEINESQNIMDEKVESVREIKAKELKSNWSDQEKFLDNKNDLLGLLKTFEAKDFMEMYLEGKKRGVLKFLKDKDFTNIMTRLKLKLPLTDMNLKKIENFYEELMNSMYSQESPLIEENLENNKDNEKDINIEDENKFEREEFDIESYTAKDWYRFYQIAQEFKVKDYLQKAIFTLWKYEERDLMISDSQYATIRRSYSELYEVIKKFESEKNGVQKNYLKNISENKENTLHEKPEKNIEKVVEDDYRWNNYEVYSLNKNNLIPVILRFCLLDFKEMLSIGSEKGILNEMEKRQMANIITWIKLSTPLVRLNLEKIEVIYKKIMEELFEKNHPLENISNSLQQEIGKNPENEIVIYDDVLSVKNEEESEIKEKSEENIIKKFNDILEIGLKDGIINIKDLQEINFDSEDDIYDIYEAIEILEERGIRINY